MFIRNFLLISAGLVSLNLKAAQAYQPKQTQPTASKAQILYTEGMLTGVGSLITGGLACALFKVSNMRHMVEPIAQGPALIAANRILLATGKISRAAAENYEKQLAGFMAKRGEARTIGKLTGAFALLSAIFSAQAFYRSYKAQQAEHNAAQPAQA